MTTIEEQMRETRGYSVEDMRMMQIEALNQETIEQRRVLVQTIRTFPTSKHKIHHITVDLLKPIVEGIRKSGPGCLLMSADYWNELKTDALRVRPFEIGSTLVRMGVHSPHCAGEFMDLPIFTDAFEFEERRILLGEVWVFAGRSVGGLDDALLAIRTNAPGSKVTRIVRS